MRWSGNWNRRGDSTFGIYRTQHVSTCSFLILHPSSIFSIFSRMEQSLFELLRYVSTYYREARTEGSRWISSGAVESVRRHH